MVSPNIPSRATKVPLILMSLALSDVLGLLPVHVPCNNVHRKHATSPSPLRLSPHSQVLDAEFQRDDDEETNVEILTTPSTPPLTKSLFDLALEADSDYNNTRIPFVEGDRSIDAKLAFIAEIDGESYGIGIPFDHSAAIAIENKDGSVEYVLPDDEENIELMEIMAVQLQQQVGENLRLKHTPRILTIVGPLEEYTNNWRNELFPKPASFDDLMDDSDEDLSFFHNFMKEELGEVVYQEVINDKSDDVSSKIEQLFHVPGLGDQQGDLEGMRELIDLMRDDDAENQASRVKEVIPDFDSDAVALKLISYILRKEKKSYSLVHPLKPYILVARCVQQPDGVRFELLTRDEAKIIVPRLEETCKADIEKLRLEHTPLVS